MLKSLFAKDAPVKVPWMIYLLLVFCFEPKIFVKIPVLNWLFIGGAVAAFVYLFAIYCMHRIRPSLVMLALIAYRLGFAVQTLLHHGDMLMWGYFSIVIVTLCALTEQVTKYRPAALIDALTNTLIALLAIHLLCGFVRPAGIIESVGFIGVRTRCTEVLLVCVVVALIADHIKGRIFSPRTAVALVLSLATAVYFRIVTALIGLAVFLFVWLVLRFIKNEKACAVLSHPVTLLALSFGATALIVFARITNHMGWLFANIFHRDPTISYRFAIWDGALAIIKNNPFFGFGMADNGNFVPIADENGVVALWQSHNQWLQLLYDGGILTVALFSVLLFVCYRRLIKRTDRYTWRCHIAGIAAFLVIMSVEIYTYTPYLFVLMLLAGTAQPSSDPCPPAAPCRALRVLGNSFTQCRTFGTAVVRARLLTHLRHSAGTYARKHAVILERLRKDFAEVLDRCKEASYNAETIREDCPIWVLWWQGLDHAPPMVRECVDSIRRHAGAHPVIVLSRDNYRQYVTLPPAIEEHFSLGHISIVHLSDLIRISVLKRNGGIWCDATLYFLRELPHEIYEHAWYSLHTADETHTFASDCRWSAFFMASCPNGSVVSVTEQLLFAYWEKYDCMIDYFLIDYCIRLACDIDAVNAAVTSVPVTTADVHYLMQHAGDVVDEETVGAIEKDTFLFKCNYRLPHEKQADLLLYRYFSLDV